MTSKAGLSPSCNHRTTPPRHSHFEKSWGPKKLDVTLVKLIGGLQVGTAPPGVSYLLRDYMFSRHEDLHPELFPKKVAQWIASINVDSVPKAM